MLQVDRIFIEHLSAYITYLIFLEHAEVQFIGREVILELGDEGFVKSLVREGKPWIFLLLGSTHERATSSGLLFLLRIRVYLFFLVFLAIHRTFLWIIFPLFVVFLHEGTLARISSVDFRVIKLLFH
jgi:hypothetical protein